MHDGHCSRSNSTMPACSWRASPRTPSDPDCVGRRKPRGRGCSTTAESASAPRRRSDNGRRRCTRRTASGIELGLEPSALVGAAASRRRPTSRMRICRACLRAAQRGARYVAAHRGAARLFARAARLARRHCQRSRRDAARAGRPRARGVQSARASAAHVLHLDLQLHQAAVTLLEVRATDGVLRRARYELLRGAGMLAFHQALAGMVAARVRAADPVRPVARRRNRTTPVRPGAWLGRRARRHPDEAEVEMTFGANTHRITLTCRAIVGRCRVARERRAATRAGARVPPVSRCSCACRIGWRRCPGCVARLATLRDCRGRRVAARRCRARRRWQRATRSRAPAESIALVHRLARRMLPAAGDAQSARLRPCRRMPCRPTCCFAARPGPSPPPPLTLGWSLADAPRALQPPLRHRRRVQIALHAASSATGRHSSKTTAPTARSSTTNAWRAMWLCVSATCCGSARPACKLDLIRVLPDHGT